jgi:hypothetical protein
VELKRGLVGWEGWAGLGGGRDRCDEGSVRGAAAAMREMDGYRVPVVLTLFRRAECGQQLLRQCRSRIDVLILCSCPVCWNFLVRLL